MTIDALIFNKRLHQFILFIFQMKFSIRGDIFNLSVNNIIHLLVCFSCFLVLNRFEKRQLVQPLLQSAAPVAANPPSATE